MIAGQKVLLVQKKEIAGFKLREKCLLGLQLLYVANECTDFPFNSFSFTTCSRFQELAQKF
jgi:hypothetical protein